MYHTNSTAAGIVLYKLAFSREMVACLSRTRAGEDSLFRLKIQDFLTAAGINPVTLTCSEAELVLLLALIVVQRSHSHTFAHIFVKGVCPSVGVVA